MRSHIIEEEEDEEHGIFDEFGSMEIEDEQSYDMKSSPFRDDKKQVEEVKDKKCNETVRL